jgi:hypothetical protein
VIQVRDPRRAVVLPLLVVTWLVALQVLSFRGVAIWVVLGSLLCVYVVGGLFESGRIKIGLFVAAVLPVGVALLADVLGGSTAGPLARSTLIVCGLASVATAIAFTRYRSLSVLVMTVMFGAVLGLGAAQSVGVWVGVWIVAAGYTLVLLGPYRRTELRGDRARSVANVLVSVGVLGVLGFTVAGAFIGTPWTIPSRADVQASVDPSGSADPGVASVPLVPQKATPLDGEAESNTTDPVIPESEQSVKPESTVDPILPPPPVEPAVADSETLPVEVSPAEVVEGVIDPVIPESEQSVDPVSTVDPLLPPPPVEPAVAESEVLPVEESPLESTINAIAVFITALVLGLLLFLFLWFVLAVIRRVGVALRWWSIRRLLRSGPPRSRVIGSWEWVRLRLAQQGSALPVSLSPDTAGVWARNNAEPELDSLSTLVAPVAFDRWAEPNSEVASEAWRRARSVDRLHVTRASWRTRWRWAGRGPGFASRALARPVDSVSDRGLSE